MTIAQSNVVPQATDRALSLAAGAWQRFCASTGRPFVAPTALVSLKPQRLERKSGVYRLEGSGERGSAVIAKRTLRASAEVERTVHERLLPRAGVSTFHYYGYLEEPSGEFCWLFMEDAGGDKLFETDRPLTGHWLARLHATMAALADEIPLPERGPAHYLGHLRATGALLARFTQDASLAHADRERLRSLYGLMERVEGSWQRICSPCASAPRTLVHGDFGRKNVRVRTSMSGARELVALDWEMAGWGPPSADIPHSPRRAPPRTVRDGPARWRGAVPLDVYAAYSNGRWDGAALEELHRVARVGTVFRSIASVRWALEQLHAGGIEKAMTKLGWYAEDLPRTLAAVEC